MAQKSGFFNALLQAGVYDRQYNADDYCDNLAVIISDGVLRSEDNDLRVTSSGLNVSVNPGRAWIKGHYYKNDSAFVLKTVTPPVGGSRIDRVVLRFNNDITVRSISLQYIEGSPATNPVAPDIIRSGSIYDLCLADVTVAAGGSSVSIVDNRADRSLCGWVYSVVGDNSFFEAYDESFEEWFEQVKNTLSSVTLFKQYKWETELGSETDTIQFNIPQYDPETCFFDVFINGILTEDYSASDSILTFDTTLIAGTEIAVYVYKSIDGTGIMTVADEITQLQNQFATLDGASKFIYKCTGLNDNVALSQISGAFNDRSVSSVTNAAAMAFLTALGGNAYLNQIPDDAKITIEVVGSCGVTTPVSGNGSAASPYRYFNLGQATRMGIHLVFDFAKCDLVIIECAANTTNTIFYGSDLDIKNLDCRAFSNDSSCNIRMMSYGEIGFIKFDSCRFFISTSGFAIIGSCGTYINCSGTVFSRDHNAFVFNPNANCLIRILGGTFKAYRSSSDYLSSAIYIPINTSGTIFAQSINCPRIEEEDFSQDYYVAAYGGKAFINMVTTSLSRYGDSSNLTVLYQVVMNYPF